MPPKPPQKPQPLSNRELSRLLKLSIEYTDIQLSKAVHASILKLQQDIRLFNSLITSYIELGNLKYAVRVFNSISSPDVVSFTALISGLAKSNREHAAIGLFFQMRDFGIEPNGYTIVALLTACMRLLNLELGSQVHAFSIKTAGYETNLSVKNALIEFYAKCGRVENVERLFDSMTVRDVFTWTEMINAYMGFGLVDSALEVFVKMPEKNFVSYNAVLSGFCRNGDGSRALRFFCKMVESGTEITDSTLTSVLHACGLTRDFKTSEQIQAFILKIDFGVNSYIQVGNAIVSMYSKCGDMENASKVFDEMSEHSVLTWNSLLAGHILNRQGENALRTWKIMEKRGVKPDTVTCGLIISAYRHTGLNLVEQCRDFFLSINSIYKIEPDSNHYACLVGVLGYWGLLEEAEDIIKKLSFGPKASVWRALLDSCRLHKRRWHCSELVRDEMKKKGFRKFPGRSWVIHENSVQSFFARDKSHLQSKDVYSALELLFLECLKEGYVPDTSFVLHEVEEHQKVNFLLYHSAKLAVAYGIITARPGKPVKVFKNIHLCGDCHAFVKYVSVVTKREIHVRDASGFHRFLNGECSCNW
ncbi:pentatricopeptide repeat-containing protein at5g03800 [Phtheirospermum japonicum]|uniref:Pentatricopeptide repeat-containing protein at5g03800 n=1 Tax=Phtheirospermum japonicum TaxID=374723 RepID=A0A830D6L3_9LAMI|nr:pentatricopeptide repeat-containing protein at5g03800 [Phtheirospermum japonicum]